ncbi:MAG: hypothetical protein ABH834_03685 [Candidatus Altiarchaeota archaeon]
MTAKLTIGDMQAIAKERGGKCLSKEYINNHTKLSWQCKKGHVWGAIPNSIKLGHWCPECALEVIGNKKRLHTIEEMREIAKSRGGGVYPRDMLTLKTNSSGSAKKDMYGGLDQMISKAATGALIAQVP